VQTSLYGNSKVAAAGLISVMIASPVARSTGPLMSSI